MSYLCMSTKLSFKNELIAYGGDEIAYTESRDPPYAHWLFRYDDGTFGAWTGDHAIEIDGVEYIGIGGIVSISGATAEAGVPQTQLKITLSGIDTTQRGLWLHDIGSKKATVEQIVSCDGVSWQKIPRAFRGRLSAPKLQGGEFSINVVKRVADVDRGRPLFWSNETQQRLSLIHISEPTRPY